MKKKPCGCIETIRKNLLAHYNASEIDFELATFINLKTGKTGTSIPPLKFKAIVGKKKIKGHVDLTFCPFCKEKL